MEYEVAEFGLGSAFVGVLEWEIFLRRSIFQFGVDGIYPEGPFGDVRHDGCTANTLRLPKSCWGDPVNSMSGEMGGVR